VAGSGQSPTKGTKVEVFYTGRLEDGTEFDSSTEDPFSFTIGNGEVITGWEEAAKCMKKGEQSLFKIHPDWAYGAAGAGGRVPPNAVLCFEIELLSFEGREKEVWEMDLWEKVAKAKQHKEKGN